MNVPTPTERTLSSAPHAAYASGFKRIAGFGIGTALLLLCIIASLMLGSKAIPFHTVWLSLQGAASGSDSTIILNARVPRTLAGILAGMALGAAGALIQALTRNPLADPGVLGINAGASFAVVIGIMFSARHHRKLYGLRLRRCRPHHPAGLPDRHAGGRTYQPGAADAGRRGDRRGVARHHHRAVADRSANLRPTALLAGRHAGYPHAVHAAGYRPRHFARLPPDAAHRPAAEYHRHGEDCYRARRTRGADSGRRGDRHHAAVRCGDRHRRPNQFHRADGAAYRPLVGRPRPALDPALLHAAGADFTAVRRRGRPFAGGR